MGEVHGGAPQAKASHARPSPSQSPRAKASHPRPSPSPEPSQASPSQEPSRAKLGHQANPSKLSQARIGQAETKEPNPCAPCIRGTRYARHPLTQQLPRPRKPRPPVIRPAPPRTRPASPLPAAAKHESRDSGAQCSACGGVLCGEWGGEWQRQGKREQNGSDHVPTPQFLCS